jgi:hypothetical protein
VLQFFYFEIISVAIKRVSILLQSYKQPRITRVLRSSESKMPKIKNKKGDERAHSGLQDCRLVASTSVLLPCLPGLLLVMKKLHSCFCAEGTSSNKKATNSIAMEKLGHADKILLRTILSTCLSDLSQLSSLADMVYSK